MIKSRKDRAVRTAVAKTNGRKEVLEFIPVQIKSGRQIVSITNISAIKSFDFSINKRSALKEYESFIMDLYSSFFVPLLTRTISTINKVTNREIRIKMYCQRSLPSREKKNFVITRYSIPKNIPKTIAHKAVNNNFLKYTPNILYNLYCFDDNIF